MASVTGTQAPPPAAGTGLGATNEVPLRPGTTEKSLRYLYPDEYAKWDALVNGSPQGSVFCRSWWLKVTDPRSQVLGYFEGGHLVAGIPLHYEKRFGLKLSCMARPTPRLGVVMEPAKGRRVTVAARETELLKIFAQHLAKENIFAHAFHPSIQNWLPFYWNGFRQTSRYTYILDNMEDPGLIWKEMKDSCRYDIRKAERRGVEVAACEPAVVLEAISKTFERQGLKRPYSDEYFRSMCDAAIANDAGRGFAAKDGQGRVHAATFFMWDRKRMYALVGGADPALRDSGATSLLYWRLIDFFAEHSAVFDFAGSKIEPVEKFLRSFGAKQEAYNYITRFPRWMEACLLLSGKI